MFTQKRYSCIYYAVKVEIYIMQIKVVDVIVAVF